MLILLLICLMLIIRRRLKDILGRDQYGDFPLLYGQTFNAQPVDYAIGGMKYEKGDHKYIPAGKNFDYVFQQKIKWFFHACGISPMMKDMLIIMHSLQTLEKARMELINEVLRLWKTCVSF